VAQSVKPARLDFGSGHDPRVMGPSPMSGSLLNAESTGDSLPLLPPLPFPLLFLSNK